MVLQNGTFEYHFVTHSRSLCVTRPKTCLLWFWLPPSFPIRSITLPFSLPFLSATLSLRSLFVTHSRSLCVTRLAQASGKTKSTRCASTYHSAWNPALSRISEVTARGTSQWPLASGTQCVLSMWFKQYTKGQYPQIDLNDQLLIE